MKLWQLVTIYLMLSLASVSMFVAGYRAGQYDLGRQRQPAPQRDPVESYRRNKADAEFDAEMRRMRAADDAHRYYVERQ